MIIKPVRLQLEPLDDLVHVVPIHEDPTEDVWLVPKGRMTSQMAAALGAVATETVRRAADEWKRSAGGLWARDTD